MVLTLLVLASSRGWGDDTRKGPPAAEDPDPGFLEFLGSVDRMAEVNPDYLAQAGRPQPGKSAAKNVAPPPPAPTPPPSAPGAKNNEQ